jgi:hypothetical protein
MIINFQGTQVVFINDQGEFRPLRPEERADNYTQKADTKKKGAVPR